MTQLTTGYATVNGLQLYYERHGIMTWSTPPLVLLHGALSTITTSFGKLLLALAERRAVIALELQGHGHTRDIDRPLTYEQMADDVAALLVQLGVERADLFGYSMGGAVALQVAMRHPHLLRKLVVAAATFTSDGVYPAALAAIDSMTPTALVGTPFHLDYGRVAPDPAAWAALVQKVQQLDRQPQTWSPTAIGAIRAPTLIVIGDADMVRPEHAITMFRLLGGGVNGDVAGLPHCQLAILPGTTHLTLVERTEWLNSMISAFLDAACRAE